MTNLSTKTTTQTTSISEPVEQLATADTNNLQQAIDTLIRELRRRSDADWIYEAWHVEDVQDRTPNLSIEQCREVLRRLNRHHDANIGINWEVIDCVAEIVESDKDVG